VDEVVDLVGLGQVVRRRAGRFSLGMGQRLGIATALLGDPSTVILDEPLNGLDTEGIRWVRSLLGDLAADDGVRLLPPDQRDGPDRSAPHRHRPGQADRRHRRGRLRRPGRGGVVRVRSTDPEELAARLRSPSVAVSPGEGGALTVSGLSTDEVGRIAGAAGITLLELTAQQASLEDAFMTVTRDAVEFRAPTTIGADQ
jgi:ABC-2 type transport system ATP-binding protein